MPALARVSAWLAAWPVQPRAARRVSQGGVEVWRVQDDAGLSYALRVHAAGSGSAGDLGLQAERLATLARGGLEVPMPRRCHGGGWVVERGEEKAMLLHWLPGRTLFDGLRPVHLHRVGRWLARLHRAGDALEAGRAAVLPDLDGWATGRRHWPPWAGPELRRSVGRAAAGLRESLSGWPRDQVHHGFVHGDLHPWNLAFCGGAVGAFDFDEAGQGWRALDLSAVLQFIEHPLHGFRDHGLQRQALRSALLDGYASERACPPSLRRQALQGVALRLLTTFEWMATDWPAPDTRRWGPDFVRRLPARLDA